MSNFEFAVEYVIRNEGGYSNHQNDRGGETLWGVTRTTAVEFGLDFDTMTLAQARDVYRDGYWLFDGIKDRRVAAKCMDVLVNFGRVGGVRVLQRATGAFVDGLYGNETEGRLNAGDPDDVLERIATAAADRYISIVENAPTQMVFLRGWIRRAIKQPPRSVAGSAN